MGIIKTKKTRNFDTITANLSSMADDLRAYVEEKDREISTCLNQIDAIQAQMDTSYNEVARSERAIEKITDFLG